MTASPATGAGAALPDLGPLALGAAPLGNLYAPVADEEAVALVRAAQRAGLRYFDTAPHYGNGLSEHRVGRALRELPRGTYVLSSKVGRLLIPDEAAPPDQNGYVGVLPFRQRYDYSFDGALRSVDDSLQRLGVARLDIVYVHDIDRATHGDAQPMRFREAMAGAIPALARLKAEGTIGGCGLGVNDWRVCVDALADADLDFILLAGRYTLLDHSALPELLPECQRRGVRIVVGGPYNSGILATGAHPSAGAVPYFNYAPASAEIVARVARIEALCAAFSVPLRAAALQFPRAHPAVATVLVGARRVAEIEENVALARQPIPRAFWSALRAEALLPANAPVPAGP
ncbi:MAG TPA: aldo/keto reductase [Casimicrobiaceae bacterium]|nr:aldo/keto reductase [Casimicrobiaceae bacterium]